MLILHSKHSALLSGRGLRQKGKRRDLISRLQESSFPSSTRDNTRQLQMPGRVLCSDSFHSRCLAGRSNQGRVPASHNRWNPWNLHRQYSPGVLNLAPALHEPVRFPLLCSTAPSVVEKMVFRSTARSILTH